MAALPLVHGGRARGDQHNSQQVTCQIRAKHRARLILGGRAWDAGLARDEITGATATGDLLERIFAEFCTGK